MLMKGSAKQKKGERVRRRAGEEEEGLARKPSLSKTTDKMEHSCPVSCWNCSSCDLIQVFFMGLTTRLES